MSREFFREFFSGPRCSSTSDTSYVRTISGEQLKNETNLKEVVIISDYNERQYPSSLEFMNKFQKVTLDEV